MAESTTTSAPRPAGTVWFVGAGPGDPELITVKGQRLIAEADLVLYAGSLVPQELLKVARPDARILDSSAMTLPQTHAAMRDAARQGALVVRLHTGDPMLYGAVKEQMALLEADRIPFFVVPGVSSAFATAAEAKVSLTLPESVQSFAITRMQGRTPVPKGQRVADYAKLGGTLAIYLSAADPAALQAELRNAKLAEDTPIVIGHKIGWPGGQTIKTTLAELATATAKHNIIRQAVFLVLPGEKNLAPTASKLYDPEFTHGYR